MRVHVIAVAMALATWTPALSAEAGAKNPQPKTLEAWGTYVAATEARMESELFTTGAFFVSDLTGDGGVLRDGSTKATSPSGQCQRLAATAEDVSAGSHDRALAGCGVGPRDLARRVAAPAAPTTPSTLRPTGASGSRGRRAEASAPRSSKSATPARPPSASSPRVRIAASRASL